MNLWICGGSKPYFQCPVFKRFLGKVSTTCFVPKWVHSMMHSWFHVSKSLLFYSWWTVWSGNHVSTSVIAASLDTCSFSVWNLHACMFSLRLRGFPPGSGGLRLPLLPSSCDGWERFQQQRAFQQNPERRRGWAENISGWMILKRQSGVGSCFTKATLHQMRTI